MFKRLHTVRVLGIAIAAACVVLLAVQTRFILNTAELERKTFDQSVASALAAAAAAIDHLEVVDRMFFVRNGTGKSVSTWTQGSPDSSVQISVLATDKGTVTTRLASGRVTTSVDRPQRITIEAYDVRGRLDTVYVDDRRVTDEQSFTVPREKYAKGTYILRLRADGGSSTFRLGPKESAGGFTVSRVDTTGREMMVRKVVESFEEPARARPWRIQASTLDSIVAQELGRHAVRAPFVAALTAGDSVVLGSPTVSASADADATFRMNLGPPMPFGRSDELVVAFPSVGSYLIGRMAVELVLSAFLVIAIVWVMVAALRTLVRQREFAARLTDFINNMTHEFKTPISTVSLATEALDRPGVARSPAKVRTYTRVIRDENARMRQHVERILQMAQLEEGDVELRRDTVAMHGMIERVVATARMGLDGEEGTIVVESGAAADTVAGDAFHLENVLRNAVENAVKYARGAPDVRITTSNAGQLFVVRVTDAGIGIPAAHLHRVFDKFYRVPTGNLHDVKGFGLGLSYVRLVVEKHGGSVSIRSEEGSGTDLELRLPLASPVPAA